MKYFSIITCIIVLFFFSCKVKVIEFDPLINVGMSNDTISYNMDLDNTINEGVRIPSFKQVKNGCFEFSFKVKNIDPNKKIFYKIYYQNESYKFNDTIIKDKKVLYNQLASENFYGSWQNTNDTFRLIKFNKQENIIVKDTFAIVGNPRNEKAYFGLKSQIISVTEKEITDKIAEINNNKDWLKSIEKKAIENKISLEKQIRADAIWTVNNDKKGGNINNRWKRNPRTGNYSFILVLTTEEELNKLPRYIKNIGLTDSNNLFVSPYYYFLHGEGANNSNIIVVKSKKILKLTASFDLASGIYFDKTKTGDNVIDETYFNNMCGNNEQLFKSAQFEQFIHYIDKNYYLQNIPVIKDVVGDKMTRNEYDEYVKKYPQDKLPKQLVSTTSCPCKTVKTDLAKKSIIIINPGNSDTKYLKKENVGIRSRIGFTYGRYIFKIRFPKILSNDNVWNGLTCAAWLLYQSEDDWNKRRICTTKGGYVPKAAKGNDSKRINILNYSEIDFEIVKDSKYWPKTSYAGYANEYKTEDASKNNNVIVACTNWDMACQTPKDFFVGIKPIYQNEKTFIFHRWDTWYQALTSKPEAPQSEVMGKDYYLYEVDWTPEQITWKIGYDENNMKTIGILDTSVSTIPNNQMLLLVTQEFHNSAWWPTAPFNQNYIPFPKNEIKGEILSITIK